MESNRMPEYSHICEARWRLSALRGSPNCGASQSQCSSSESASSLVRMHSGQPAQMPPQRP